MGDGLTTWERHLLTASRDAGSLSPAVSRYRPLPVTGRTAGGEELQVEHSRLTLDFTLQRDPRRRTQLHPPGLGACGPARSHTGGVVALGLRYLVTTATHTPPPYRNQSERKRGASNLAVPSSSIKGAGYSSSLSRHRASWGSAPQAI